MDTTAQRGRQKGWIDAIILDLLRQMRWSFLPPLMVYFAFGFTGLTAIVGTFFVKEYLDLSAAYLAGLAFWAGIPWALKMPLGHLVDIIWRWKWVLVWFGAGLVAFSVGIMYLVLTAPQMMQAVMPLASWYVASTIIAPCGLVIQDAVADAMSVEAVPKTDAQGAPLPEDQEKAMHVTMQMLGRFALITGTLAVALLNIVMFSGIENLTQPQKAEIYATIYLTALIIPVISVSGVVLGGLQKRLKRRRLIAAGLTPQEAFEATEARDEATQVNPWYFIGGGAFVVLTLIIGLGQVPYGQEIIFAGSMTIVLLLMRQLMQALPQAQARMLMGTAAIIFAFRATPLPGEGLTWFNIDVLGFDQQFLSVLSLITAVITLAAMLVLRPVMARRSIVYVIVVLTLAAGVLSLPNLGLYYGVQTWTAAVTGGIVDARFIAILDTAVESPLAQIAMIPMLAWIARNAPVALKATFFAVMASFTNLALSASRLGEKYLNQIFTVTREVRDGDTGVIQTAANYAELGMLLITVAILTVGIPLLVVWMVQRSPLKTTE
ncbi:MAG: hypothetical protein AAFY25_10030 [Pseudomonadota bacterium]